MLEKCSNAQPSLISKYNTFHLFVTEVIWLVEKKIFKNGFVNDCSFCIFLCNSCNISLDVLRLILLVYFLQIYKLTDIIIFSPSRIVNISFTHFLI